VPPEETATPVWFESTGFPFPRIEYMALACVADTRTTLVTKADAWAASGEWALDS